jgi:filamentous hemagglutinin family protein
MVWRRAIACASPYAIQSASAFFFNLAAIGAAMAQPTGGTVVAGQASIANTGATTLITQSTPKAIINWQDFSVAGGQTVQFAQPGSASITLNRVTGGAASVINGAVLANGQVWILNANGILFGQSSTIHVGGLLATTSDIANNDFLSGNYSFSGGNGTIVNNGTIKAAKGGSVVMSAPKVTNNGLIKATAGHVVLAGTDTFTVDFNGDHLLSYAVGASSKTGTVTNSGMIKAAGGDVLLTARAASNVADGVINNTGMVEATSVRKGENGEIILDAGDGAAETSGTLDASGKKPGETGGTVEVLGQTVTVADGAKIDVSGDAGGGTALIGGNFKGAGPEQNAVATTVGKATIKADAVTSGNGGQVAIYSTGSTTVTASVSAKGGAGGAGGEIETSGHFLNFDGSTIDAGAGGSWLLDPYDLTVDTTAASSIDTSLGGGTNVTLQTTASGASGPGNQNASGNGDILINAPLTWSGSGVLTLSAYRNIQFNANVTVQTSGGVVISPATGGSGDYFFGPGYSLSFSTLTDAPTLHIYSQPYTLVSSISQLATGIAANTGGSFALAKSYNASADGTYSSAPVATTFSGIFTGLGNSIANLSINSSGTVVGLFKTVSGTVRDIILSNATVSANAYVGALVGDAASGSTFQSDSTTGTVTGTGTAGYTGGLAGENFGTVINDFSTATVAGGNGSYIGGLVGYNTGAILRSFASGAVSGGGGSGCCIGGLAGQNNAGGTITDSYATGAVHSNANQYAGGLVGHNNGGAIYTSYATGAVSGAPGNYGGLVGNNGGTVSGSYWDTDTNATDNSGSGASGLTTAQLTAILPSGFDGQWANGPNATSPYLLENQAGSVLIGSSATTRYSVIFTMAQMQAINGDPNVNDSSTTLAANYTMARNIDASSTSGWTPIGVDSSGTPLNSGNGFTGIFDGLGNTISNLTISHGTMNYQGLFGVASNGAIRDLGLIGGSVTGGSSVGGLAGQATNETISNDYTTGNVTGSGNYVGGLVGQDSGTISNSYETGNVSASGTGQYDVGGLVGEGGGGSISLSYATGNVTVGSGNDGLGGYDGVGGLIGQNYSNTISQSYATGSVTGGTGTVHVGGLAGWNNGTIVNSYAMGAVSSGANAQAIGGLLGLAVNGGSISSSYSTGAVTGGAGASALGGFVGQNLGGSTITGNYWNTQTSGLSTDSSGSGATGLTTAQLQSTLPSGFSASVWGTGTGFYPYFLWQYPSVPQVVAGFAYTDHGVTPMASGAGGAVTVAGLANGVSLGSSTTGANGYYYITAPAGTIAASNGQVLTYVASGGSGNTFKDNANGSAGSLNIYGNTLLVQSQGAALSTLETDLATARGTAAGTGFLFSTASPLVLNSGANFELDSTGSITVDTALTTTGGGVTLDANMGGGGGAVNVAAAVATGGGAITIGGGATPTTLPAMGVAAQNDGVDINAALNSGGGPISIYGAGFGTGGIGVSVGQTISASGGSISITGTGGAGAGASNYGINQIATISTTGSGSIILNGTGGGTGNSETGYLTNASVTAGTGNISITGTGSPTSTGTNSNGIRAPSSANIQISTAGTGTITLMGTASGGSGTAVGAAFSPHVTISAVDGLIRITGVNNSTGTGINPGVQSQGTLTSSGIGGITVNGAGGGASTSSTSSGVIFANTASTVVTGSGAISITGAGGDNGGTGANNYGVDIESPISAVGGAISITGAGGASAGNSNHGILVNGALANASGGAITLMGTGGGTGVSAQNYGVDIAAVISGGLGAVNITGTGGASTGGSNYGIYQTAAVSNYNFMAGGNITLTGTGGGNSNDNNTGYYTSANVTAGVSGGGGNILITGMGAAAAIGQGIDIESTATLSTTASGTIALYGTGTGSTGTVYGLLNAGTISAVDGLITLHGVDSSSGTDGYNYGVINTGMITSTGMGGVSISGTAGGAGASAGNSGVYLMNGSTLQETGSGAISITGTGGNSSGSGNVGVHLDGVVSSSGAGSITINGTGGGTGPNESGYTQLGAVTAGTGNIAITGMASATATGTYNDGLDLQTGSISTTGAGTITLAGTATGNLSSGTTYGIYGFGVTVSTVDGLLQATGTNTSIGSASNNDGVLINAGAFKSAGAGGVNVTGIGAGSGAGGSNYGVDLEVANGLQANGSGAITINGTGGGGVGGTSSNNYGIFVNGAISGSGIGAVSLSGTGGNTGGSNNYGVYQTSAINNFVAGLGGDITIMANGGGTGTGESGYVTSANVRAANTSASTYGNIFISGAAATGAATGAGVDILNGAALTTGGPGTVTIYGTAAGTASFAEGIHNAGSISAVDGNINLNGNNTNSSADGGNYGVINVGSITSSGAGTIAVSGTAGGAGAGGGNSGVYLPSGSTLQANGSGGITIIGHGGGGSGDDNYGVDIEAPISAAGGGIDITGYGGASSGNGNSGILVNSGIGNTNQGTIALLGHGGGTLSSASNYGVDIEAQLIGGGGEISVTGAGGANAGDNNYGIYQGAQITNYNAGIGADVLIHGTGGGSGNNEIGYYTLAGITAGDPAASTNGDILITGAASPGATGSGSHGVEIGSSSTIATYGYGIITVMGTAQGGAGGNTDGVWLKNAATLSSANGLITVTGANENIGSGTLNNGIQIDGTITSSSKGGITLTGAGGGFGSSNYGVYLSTSTAVQTPGGGEASITGTGGDFSQSSSGNIGVYVAQPLTFGADVAITGTGGGSGDSANPGISLNGGITASTGTITLTSASFVSAAGALTATNLDLEGNGIFTLNNTSSNAVTNLYGHVNTLQFAQTGDLALGSGDGSSGLNAQSFINLNVAGKVTQTFGLTVGSDLSVTTTGTGNGITLDDQGYGSDPGNIVGGTARFNSAADVNYATVGNVANTIGNSEVAGNLYVYVSGPLMLADTAGAVTVTGSTDLTGSSIGQTIPLQTQALQLYSSDGDTVMTNAGNQVTGIVNITAQSDGIANGYFVNSGPTILGNSSVSGALSVIATGANATLTLNDTESYQIAAGDIIFQAGAGITQAMYGPSLYTGSLTASAASGAITLNNVYNTVSGLVRFSTQSGDVTFNNSTTTQLGASSVNGNLTVAAFGTDGGDAQILIADPNGGTVHVTGNTALSADTDIVQGQSYDAGSGSLDSTNAIALQTGALDVENGGVIELFHPANAITGAITLTTFSDPDIYNSGATILGTTNVLGNINLQSGGSLTVTGAVSADYGLITLVANGGDLTLAPGASISSYGASGDTIVLATSGNFINNSGAGSSTLSAGNGNSWKIYSAGPGADVFGGLDSGNKAIWDTDFATTVRVSQTGNRYVFAYQPLLSVSANNISKTYGADASASLAGSFTVLGVQPGVAGAFLGDTAADAYSGTATLASAGAAASANVGRYAIVINAANITAMDGYALSGSSGASVTVNPATLTYTANAASRIYGAATPALGGTVTGFVNGDTQASATSGTLAFASTATAASGVGSYAVNGLGLSASNYVFVQAAGNATALTINPATLTYVANSANRLYGAPNPTLSGMVTGFVNGDTLKSATTGTLAFATSATVNSNVGNYSVTGSGLNAANYVFVQANANASALTVNPATLTYVANAASRIDGQANGAFSGSVAGFVNGDTLTSATKGTLNFTSAATAGSDVGVYAIAGSGLTAGNYTFIQAAGNASALTINPATLTIALTGTVSKTFDGSNAATLTPSNYTALSGIFGTDAVSLASYPASGTYDSATVGTGKTVTVSGLSLTGSKAADYIIANTISGAVGVINAVTTTVTTTATVLNATTTAILKGFTAAIAAATPLPTTATTPTAPTPTTPQANTIGAAPITAITASLIPPSPTAPANGGNQASDPPTSSDAATSSVAQSLDGGPPPNVGSAAGGVVIPHFLVVHPAAPSAPLTPGALPSWGNAGLWQ